MQRSRENYIVDTRVSAPAVNVLWSLSLLRSLCLVLRPWRGPCGPVGKTATTGLETNKQVKTKFDFQKGQLWGGTDFKYL